MTLTEWSQPDLFAKSNKLWPAERIDELRRLAADGLSCSQIAAALGVTRNSVIGKMRRNGISNGRSPWAHNPAKPQREPKPRALHWTGLPKRKSPRRKPPTIPDGYQCAPIEYIPIEQRKSLLELTDQTCRWPIGHPGEADFYFCGGNAVPGLPYCGGHARIAYAPPRVRSPSIAPREAA